MKLLRIWVLVFLSVSLSSFAQRNTDAIVDTVETADGPVILYKNFTWEYLQDEPVMLSLDEDSTGLFSNQWINDQIFAYRQKVIASRFGCSQTHG